MWFNELSKCYNLHQRLAKLKAGDGATEPNAADAVAATTQALKTEQFGERIRQKLVGVPKSVFSPKKQQLTGSDVIDVKMDPSEAFDLLQKEDVSEEEQIVLDQLMDAFKKHHTAASTATLVRIDWGTNYVVSSDGAIMSYRCTSPVPMKQVT